MKILLFALFILLYGACASKFNKQQFDGFWVNKNNQIFEIQEDSIALVDILRQEKINVPLRLTADSLHLWNPCVEDRQAYTLIQDTVFVKNEKALIRINRREVPLFFAEKKLAIELKKSNLVKKDSIPTLTYPRVAYALLIGKIEQDTIRSFFNNGYALLVGDAILEDSLDFGAWREQTKNLNMPLVLTLYVDKNFSDADKQHFCRKVLNALPNAQLYEGLYAPDNELFMDFVRVK